MPALSVKEAFDFMNVQSRELKLAREALAEATAKQQAAELRCQVREDIVLFWIPRIVKAMQKGKSEAHNHRLWWWSACDNTYLLNLQSMLGQKFKVERAFDGWGQAYTQVSW